jgi:hypothetical protein
MINCFLLLFFFFFLKNLTRIPRTCAIEFSSASTFHPDQAFPFEIFVMSETRIRVIDPQNPVAPAVPTS